MNVSTIRSLNLKLNRLIDSLPDDIKKYIYKEFLETEIKYKIIHTFFEIECNSLSCKSSLILTKYVIIILNNKKLKDMFMQNVPSFKTICERKKTVKQFYTLISNPYEDFAVAWMFNQYH